MNAAPKLSLVVPAYNEAANVATVVREILATFAGEAWAGPLELVLVDDGSTDGTGAVMDRLAAEHAEVVVVHHAANRGFGAALKSGFARSRGAFVSLVTADGEIGADQPLQLLRVIGDRDLVISRRERTVNAGRKVLTWGIDLLMRLMLGFVPDGSVGIYLIRGDLLRAIPLHSDTGLVNLEVILYCKRTGKAIATEGITVARPRLSGASKVTNLRTIVHTLWDMLKLRWRLRGSAA